MPTPLATALASARRHREGNWVRRLDLLFFEAPQVGPGGIVAPLAASEDQENRDQDGRRQRNGNQGRDHSWILGASVRPTLKTANEARKGPQSFGNSPDKEADSVDFRASPWLLVSLSDMVPAAKRLRRLQTAPESLQRYQASTDRAQRIGRSTPEG